MLNVANEAPWKDSLQGLLDRAMKKVFQEIFLSKISFSLLLLSIQTNLPR